MAETLAMLRRGTPFETVLASIEAAWPFAGQQWEKAESIADGYDNAGSWSGPEGAFEAVSEDLAVAVEDDLITAAEYDEAIAVVNR